MMRRLLGSCSLAVGALTVAMAQEPTAPPTNLMPTFKGSTPTAPVSGNAPGQFTLQPVFPKEQIKQQRPDPGWELKPEHGEWLIEVKSYAQVESGIMAQAFAKEVRDKYKAPVYLFEWASEARAKKEAEEAASRKRIEDEMRPFMEHQAKMKAEAEARGEVFDETPLRVKVPVYYRGIPDQYLVLVGGYKDIDTARKALDIIKKWPTPSDPRLLDTVERVVMKDGKKVFETSYVNPFAEARVVRNLTWPKQQTAQRDEFLLRLNDSEPLSICRSKSKYTMVVKAFNCPVSKAGAEEDTKSKGPRAGMAKPGQWLDATAQQSQEMATKLRSLMDLNNKPIGFDAFVLHHRTGSFVTVGQYETPDDPKLKSDFDRVWKMSYVKSENKDNKMGQRIADQKGLFDMPYLMEIPR